MEIQTDSAGAGSPGEISDLSSMFGQLRGENAGASEQGSVEKEIRLIYELITAMADSFESVRADQKKIREDLGATVEYLGKLIMSKPFMDMSPRNISRPEGSVSPPPVIPVPDSRMSEPESEPEMTAPKQPVFRNGRTYV